MMQAVVKVHVNKRGDIVGVQSIQGVYEGLKAYDVASKLNDVETLSWIMYVVRNVGERY